MSIPTFTLKKIPTDIERMYEFNKGLTKLAKQAVSEMHTKEMEGTLHNLSHLMTGNYGDNEAIEIPVDVIREITLFAGIALSRLLHERYKLEKSLGRSVVERDPTIPAADDLTDAAPEGIIEETETQETENVED